jgi:tetratricopeptide (TPR) repeat protein
MNVNILSFCLLLLAIISCKNEKTTIDKNDIAYLESAYLETKADTTFNQLVQAYGKAITKSTDNTLKQSLLVKAIDLCNVPEKSTLKEVFSLELLKTNPNHERAADMLFELAENMEFRNKMDAAAMLYSGFSKRFPNDSRTKAAQEKIKTDQENHETYFKKLAKDILNNPGQKGINAASTELFIDMSESFAISFPNEKMAPAYLFNAAGMARTLGSLPKTIGLYDWITQYYPNFEKAPLALFLKGFALDSEIGNFDAAKEVYEHFLAKHPQDSLVKDVKFLLENLGKSPDQMFKEMEMEKQ